jgi:hypothetical protein
MPQETCSCRGTEVATSSVQDAIWIVQETREGLAMKVRRTAKQMSTRVVKTARIAIPVVVLLSMVIAAAPLQAQSQLPIVAGQSIGLVALGMSRDQAAKNDPNKLVYASFRENKASTLFTPWGGTFATADGVGVGTPAWVIEAIYGQGVESDKRKSSDVTIWCRWYNTKGIGFSGFTTPEGSGMVTGVWIYQRGATADHIKHEWDCATRPDDSGTDG